VVGAAVLVFALALGLRLIHLYSIRDIGFFNHPVSDGLIFDQRARGIAAGDWLGPADFVHAPLYAYVLGVIQIAAGHDLWAVRVAQILLGSLSCVLLLLAARRFFNSRIAVVAALLLAVYPPAIFFDGLIQKTTLALFLSTLLLWLLGVCASRPGIGRWLAAGAVSGLLALTRQNALALVPLLLAWLWIRSAHVPVRRRLWCTLACCVGLAVTLLPWAVRNRVLTGEFVLTTPNLGQNFAMGNHPEATGTYLPFKRGRGSAEFEQQEWVKAAEQALGRELSPREVSKYYLDAAVAYIKAQPAAWLRLMVKKCLMVWNSYEAFDTQDYYLYQEWSPLLRILDRVFHFGVLCPLAAAGVVLTWSRRRGLWLLYAWLLITTLAVAAFVVFARYRFPLVPVLLMFAGGAVVEVVTLVHQGRLRRLGVPALTVQRNVAVSWVAADLRVGRGDPERPTRRSAATGLWMSCAVLLIALLAAVVANWPVHSPRRPRPVSYTNHGVALAAQGRFKEDLAEIAKALALNPDNVDAHLAAGNSLLELRRYEEALGHFEQARLGDPDYAGTYRGLGDALQGLRRFDEAAQHYEQALGLDPADLTTLTGLAGVAAQQGRFSEAAGLCQQVLRLDPTFAAAHLNLGNTYALAGRLDEAAAAYERALDHQPDYVNALYNLGLVELRRGQVDRAVNALRRALELQPERQDVAATLEAVINSRPSAPTGDKAAP